MKKFAQVFFSWFPFAVVITLFCGLVYGAVQQDIRQAANDPQIQMAEDTAAALARGQSPQAVSASQTVDISRSLTPFIIVFNDTGQPITSTALLHGHIPTIPGGVFDYAKVNGEDRFTWEPEDGVRSAVIVIHYNGPTSGFVLAGRSLREIESRENRLMLDVGIAWLVSLATTFIVITIGRLFLKDFKKR